MCTCGLCRVSLPLSLCVLPHTLPNLTAHLGTSPGHCGAMSPGASGAGAGCDCGVLREIQEKRQS